MDQKITIKTPITIEEVQKLRAGDNVLITGPLYTARDAAHKRLTDLLQAANHYHLT
jgi:fumarate hydratase subunit beta